MDTETEPILADPKPWQALVEWLDSLGMAADLIDDEYSDLAHRQVNFHQVQEIVECFFLVQDSATVYHEGQARGLPIGILNAPEDLYDDDHLNERGYFVCVEQPGFGPVPRPVAAYRFSDLDVVAPQPAAHLGEHTAAVLGGAP